MCNIQLTTTIILVLQKIDCYLDFVLFGTTLQLSTFYIFNLHLLLSKIIIII